MTYNYFMDDNRRYPTQKIQTRSYAIDLELPEEQRQYYVFEIRETNGMIKHTQVLKRNQAFKINCDLAIKAMNGSIFGYSLAYKSDDLELITNERSLLISDYSLVNSDIEKTERSEKIKSNFKKLIKYTLILFVLYVIFIK